MHHAFFFRNQNLLPRCFPFPPPQVLFSFSSPSLPLLWFFLFCFVLFCFVFCWIHFACTSTREKVDSFFCWSYNFCTPARQTQKFQKVWRAIEEKQASAQARKGSTQNVVRSRNWLRLACGTKPKRIRWEFWMRKGLLVGCGGALQPMGPLKKKKNLNLKREVMDGWDLVGGKGRSLEGD